MKKFLEAKSPLSMLKTKMEIKSKRVEAFGVFHDELGAMVKEQTKFI